MAGGVVSQKVLKECDLVQQAIVGDEDARQRLFKIHTPRLYRTAFALLRNKEDAEDAVQESWYKAYINLHHFEGRSAFSTWLTRIVINSALMLRRKKKVRTESLDELLETQSKPVMARMVVERPNPERLCLAVEMHALIEEQVRELPPAIQSAFRLREVEGFSTTESVQVLGIHKSAFKSRVSRARRRLARALKHSILRPARDFAARGRVSLNNLSHSWASHNNVRTI
jgi:RNA polymerase sigma-70 factor, ECF subfamily